MTPDTFTRPGLFIYKNKKKIGSTGHNTRQPLPDLVTFNIKYGWVAMIPPPSVTSIPTHDINRWGLELLTPLPSPPPLRTTKASGKGAHATKIVELPHNLKQKTIMY